MRVLVTGGTGVIGDGLIPALLLNNHTVRLLSRKAGEDIREWPTGVEPFTADVTRPETLNNAADGCDVVVHITGIAEESPPETTFQKVNVEGTRNILRETKRAGVRRFIYISSLGAERGTSDYHMSKRAAEDVVREFDGDWLILRPGGVYGPKDEGISTLLKMVRTLPAVPVLDASDYRFQPLWYQDLASAIVRAIERDDLSHQTLELAGDEVVTLSEIVDRLCAITGRDPARVPLPSFLASWGVKLAEVLGAGVPFSQTTLTMMLEENFIQKPVPNAVIGTFGITPVKLDEGLQLLADSLPEQLPQEGVGGLERKRYWADISGSSHSPEELCRMFQQNIATIMPIDFRAEPGAPSVVEKGATFTGAIPGRGNIQMRVEEVTDTRVTLATLEGHPLAGVVRFIFEPRKGPVRFMVEVYARPADVFDFVAVRTVGTAVQHANWVTVVKRVVEMSGGFASEGVQHDRTTLDDQKTEKVESWIADLVLQRKREEHAGFKPATQPEIRA